MVCIRLLGDLDVQSGDGGPVRFTTRKTALLFAALVLIGRRGQRREILAEMFWPDRDDAQARNSLRQALADIRRWFPAADGNAIQLSGDQDTVEIVVHAELTDVWLFDRCAASSQTDDLLRAADLYQGELLASETFPEEVSDWFGQYRSRFHAKAEQLAEGLSLANLDAAGSLSCQSLAERLIAANPTSEAAHRALMRLHSAAGRQNAALRQFQSCRELVRKHLDVEPETQTLALAETLRSRQSAPRSQPALAATEMPEIARPASPARRREQPSVAVMPFDNLGGPGDDYFADGVVEEITAALSRVRDFFVIARQSTFAYKGRFVDVRAVSKELGVNYVVEGTVRRGGERLRISVQLVDPETRSQLWSERFEGSIEDIFDFQDKIAAQVAGAIHPAIRGAEIQLAEMKPPADLRAYDLVVRAYPMIWGRSKEANDEAIDLLRKAIAIDPAYGRAHALLAWCHASKAAYLWTDSPDRELAVARSAIDATGAFGDDPTALTAAGAALSMCGDQARATTLIERALTLDPNNAWAWTRLGWVALYKDENHRGTECFTRAMELSPRDPLGFNMRLGMATSLAKQGSLGHAIAIAKEVIDTYPDILMSYRYLAAWAAMNGELETARKAAEKLLAAQPDFTIERYRALPFFRHMPEWADQVADALRLTGLPER